MKPFSENIIFYDTEFSSLNPYEGEILSIGIIKMNGEELYLELEHSGPISEWSSKNIIPTLNNKKYSRIEAQKLITEFIGTLKPYPICYVNTYDIIYLYKLFGVEHQPCYWLPIDFASIMFSDGRDPEKLLELAMELGIDLSHYKQHNALDDAKLLRDIYLKYLNSKGLLNK